MTQTERDDVDTLLELVARNRNVTPLPSAIAAARADLYELHAVAGAAAWRSAMTVALDAAQNEANPLRGNVASFVGKIIAEVNTVATQAAPHRATRSRFESPPDPSTTVEVRARIRRQLIEMSHALNATEDLR